LQWNDGRVTTRGAFERVPLASLADQSLYNSGKAYEHMWRRPDLDAQYGTNALASFEQMATLYPGSKLAPDAQYLLGWVRVTTGDQHGGMADLRAFLAATGVLLLLTLATSEITVARARDAAAS